MRADPEKFLSSINAASPLETVRSKNYRWNSATRGGEPSLILQQTISGCGVFRHNGKSRPVPAGSLFIALVPERSEYFFVPALADHWTFRWVNLGGFCREIWGALRAQHGAVLDLADQPEATRAMIGLIEDYESGALGSPEIRSVMIYSHFVTTHLALQGGAPPAVDDAARLREAISSRFREPVNIKLISAGLGVSREHATRKFRAAYGVSPSDYLRRKRVATAEALLRFGSLSALEVARRCGFTDARQLSRALLAERGQSARELRRSR